MREYPRLFKKGVNEMKKTALALLILIVLTSCAKGPTIYFHPDVNLTYVKKVAVLPFKNFSKDKNAGEITRDIFVTELLASGLFEVVAYGETLRVLQETEVRETEKLSTGDAKRISKRLGVQGLILGAVNEYGMTGRTLPYPEVSISARLVETPSGVVVWKASYTVKGATVLYRLFGVGGKTKIEAVKKAAHTLVDTLK